MPLVEESDPTSFRWLGSINDEVLGDLNAKGSDGLPESYTLDQLSRLSGVLKGTQDSLESGPFAIWREACTGQPLDTEWFQIENGSLWDCGYVLWDWAGMAPRDLQIRCQQAETAEHECHRFGGGWTFQDIDRSELQRTDIYMAGGRGYWPHHGTDFSLIHGLSEEVQDRLVEKWKRPAFGRTLELDRAPKPAYTVPSL